jgi:hypothetical protein
MPKPSRWKKAGAVQWDDHDAVIVFDKDGNMVRVKRWLQVKRFLFGGGRG